MGPCQGSDAISIMAIRSMIYYSKETNVKYKCPLCNRERLYIYRNWPDSFYNKPCLALKCDCCGKFITDWLSKEDMIAAVKPYERLKKLKEI